MGLSTAVIIFIPLRSKQHFIPFQDINQCLLADICNHTWIPECGFETNHSHHRLFLDECDLFEYNCDNNLMYKVTNYSECFTASAGCLTVPSLLTRVQGFYIYYANGRRVMYSYTTPAKPRKRTTYYTLPTTATKPRTTNWNQRRRFTPQATGKYKPWSDYTATKKRTTYMVDMRETRIVNRPLLEPPPIELVTKRTTKQTTKRTTKRTTQWTTKRTTKYTTKRTKPTTQILRTGTIGTVLLNKITVWRNGTMFFKVIKGYKAPIITTNVDSDFLE